MQTWCPTMDLLALSTADGQLRVYRLNWQRLWQVTSEHVVTALCWRPDGKAIATGQEDGSIVLYDVEDGEVLHRSKVHVEHVTCVCWSEVPCAYGSAQPEYEDRTPRFLPPITAASSTSSLSQQAWSYNIAAETQDALPTGGHWAASAAKLNLLCTGDAGGRLAMHGFGVYRVLFPGLPPCAGRLAMRSFGVYRVATSEAVAGRVGPVPAARSPVKAGLAGSTEALLQAQRPSPMSRSPPTSAGDAPSTPPWVDWVMRCSSPAEAFAIAWEPLDGCTLELTVVTVKGGKARCALNAHGDGLQAVLAPRPLLANSEGLLDHTRCQALCSWPPQVRGHWCSQAVPSAIAAVLLSAFLAFLSL
ncbi:Anaphase-promoting complex subunit 4 [Cymbomonas tetramitiformis]|uniref:Anaphase-promoting complex subunit 4 n=1 Tax=Cymbomonas tetramitiformis TaxID=36881 RepID=A0AAE0L556_9CHLO|nr:Anaphase-promoting complex subunit 4 [Cymbomonas tetramitiformis]